MDQSVIWKYELGVAMALLEAPVRDIEMPKDAKIISAGVQGNVVVIWAEVNERNEKESCRVFTIPTGMIYGRHDDVKFVGSVTDPLGLVFHIFVE